MRRNAARNCNPQSQRRLPSRSPVKHSECTRASGGAASPACSGCPIRMARCSIPLSGARKAATRASGASARGTCASAALTRRAASRSGCDSTSWPPTASKPRRAAMLSAPSTAGAASAAGSSRPSFAKASPADACAGAETRVIGSLSICSAVGSAAPRSVAGSSRPWVCSAATSMPGSIGRRSKAAARMGLISSTGSAAASAARSRKPSAPAVSAAISTSESGRGPVPPSVARSSTGVPRRSSAAAR